MKRTTIKRIVAALLAASFAFSLAACGGDPVDTDDSTGTGTDTDAESESATDTTGTDIPDIGDIIEEDFTLVELPEVESWDGVKVAGVGTVAGDAVLYDEGISLVYDEELGKNVVKLDGGNGYLKLPNDIWDKATEGFTVKFYVKPDKGAESLSNIFQTNLCGYSVGDTTWRDAPEISLTVGGDVRVFVGGRTINGVYNAAATYNNGIAGDDKAYSEPRGHKPRFTGTTTAIAKGEWSEVIISVSKDELNIYVNGEETKVTKNASDGSNISSALNYLFGDYSNGENLLPQYVNTSIGNSVYGDVPNFVGCVGDIRVYSQALDPDTVIRTHADYIWNFNGDNIDTSGEAETTIEDLDSYLGNTPLEVVDGLTVTSPDGQTVVTIRRDDAQRYYYSVAEGNSVIVRNSLIGFEAKEGVLKETLKVREGSVATDYVKETYDIITGMNATATDEHNELRFTLEGEDGSFDFVIRVFDDGVAYKYENVTFGDSEKITVTREHSEVVLTSTSRTWSHAINATYEAEFVKRNKSQLESLTSKLSTPMLVNTGEYWMLIAQAGIINNGGEYCACGLQTESGSLSLRWEFGLDRDPNREATGELDRPGHLDITQVKTKNGFSTPWRVLVISDDLEEFTESTIIMDLNPEADEELFADTSYIEPGRVAWSWWAEEGEQNNYNKHIEYIDFAAANGWEYVCLDAYWRAFENRIGEMCEYAEEKGVGLFVWVNYRDIKDQANLEKLFKSWADAGVRGIKTDYFESDAPNVLQVMENTAICAAENRLMLLYHGCVHPGGESRTYPNILTVEAVLGEENHKWSALPTIESCLTFPFTRNICGPMDYTPVATKVGSNESTHGFGLAMTVVYESGLQHLASSAASYKLYNGLSFLNNLSVQWDESTLIEGYPGEYITVARRSSEDWYIGAMTLEAKTASVPLSFLGDGEYNAYIYRDKEDGSRLMIEERTVTASDTLELSLLDAGGAAVIITKRDIDTHVEGTIDYDNYTYYEAEASTNTKRGAAVNQSSSTCSGGAKVGYVGLGAGNTLTINKVTVEEAGTYTLVLYYCTGENRKVTLTVNGEDVYELTNLNSGSFANPASVSIEVELLAGENTVTFSNNSAYAPDIDMIGISNEMK